MHPVTQRFRSLMQLVCLFILYMLLEVEYSMHAAIAEITYMLHFNISVTELRASML